MRPLRIASKVAIPQTAMKPIRLCAPAAIAVVLLTSCDKPSSKLAELERKANEAVARQQELERQIEDQRLAAERDAIERERMEIEEARAALERQKGEAATAEAEKLRQRDRQLEPP